MGKLLAGVSVKDITGTEEMFQLFRDSGRYAYTGAYKHIYLRVLILTDGSERFVYVASDLSYMVVNDDIRKAMKELGIAEKDCFFSGTRCHNAFSGWKDVPFDQMDKAHEVYGKFWLETMIACVHEAMENLKPAKIGATVVESNINTFREVYTEVGNFEGMNHNGPRAPWLRVVRVADENDETMAVLANYCMQNCTLYWPTFYNEFTELSADTAGEVIDFVEKAGKHKFPLFWSVGGGQDQQTITYSLCDRVDVNEEGELYYVHDTMSAESVLQMMRYYGCEQGLDILRAMKSIDTYSDEFNYYSDEAFADVPRRKSFGHPPMVYDPKTSNIRPELVDTPVKFRYKMAIIDGIAFCATNARLFSETYKMIADMMPFETTVLFDDCYDSCSAIAPPKYEEEGLSCHASLQCETYSMRLNWNACISGFNTLLSKYMFKKNPVYGYAPYPGEE